MKTKHVKLRLKLHFIEALTAVLPEQYTLRTYLQECIINGAETYKPRESIKLKTRRKPSAQVTLRLPATTYLALCGQSLLHEIPVGSVCKGIIMAEVYYKKEGLLSIF